jgi:hypothetical protein
MRFRVASTALLFFSLILTSCTPKPAPSLNLQYTPGPPTDKGKSISVSVINPYVIGTPANDNADKEPGPADTIPHVYTSDYTLRLQKAMLSDFENIFRVKGFTINQSFESVDQIPQEEIQKTDLLIAPTFDGGPLVTNNQTIYRYPTGTILVANIGTIQIIGTLTVEFIDPKSMKKIMTKTVYTDSFGSSFAAEYQNEGEAQEKCMELLNEAYPVLMRRAEKEINVDNLLKALKDIRLLNENRR